MLPSLRGGSGAKLLHQIISLWISSERTTRKLIVESTIEEKYDHDEEYGIPATYSTRRRKSSWRSIVGRRPLDALASAGMLLQDPTTAICGGGVHALRRGCIGISLGIQHRLSPNSRQAINVVGIIWLNTKRPSTKSPIS